MKEFNLKNNIFTFPLPNNVWADGSKVKFEIRGFKGDITKIKRFNFTNTKNNPIPFFNCLKPIVKRKIIIPLYNLRRKELFLFPVCSLFCARKIKKVIDNAVENTYS